MGTASNWGNVWFTQMLEAAVHCEIWQIRTKVHEKWWPFTVLMKKVDVYAECQLTSDANKNTFPSEFFLCWLSKKHPAKL